MRLPKDGIILRSILTRFSYLQLLQNINDRFIFLNFILLLLNAVTLFPVTKSPVKTRGGVQREAVKKVGGSRWWSAHYLFSMAQ